MAYRLFAVLLLLIVAWALALSIVPPPAAAAPRAISQEECAGFADMALVVRALSAIGISKEKAREAMAHIYTLPPGERVRDIAQAVLDSGYADQRSAKDFAQALANACVGRMGDMDSVLGVKL